MNTRTIVLRRGQEYTKHGITFTIGEPVDVDDPIADELLETGWFSEFTSTDLSEEFGIEETHTPAKQPKNILSEDEDLSGKRILLRRHGAIGDVVFVLVFAGWLKSKFPSCHITVGVQSDQVAFVRTVDCIDAVLELQESMRIDVIASMDYLFPFHGVIEEMAPERENYFDLHWKRCGLSGAPVDLPLLSVNNITTQLMTQKEANDVLRKAGIEDGEDYVVVLLGTSHPLKRLPKEALQTIVDRISTGSSAALNAERTSRNSRAKRKSTDEETQRIKVLCVGTRDDRVLEMTSQWMATANDQSLVCSAELVRRSRLVIGADTGLTHYAAAIGVPVVTFWGPTNPLNTMPNYSAPSVALCAGPEPENEKERNPSGYPVVYLNHRFCSPCGWLRAAKCPYYTGGYAECMREIPTELIVDSAYKLLADHATHPARNARPDMAISVSGTQSPVTIDTDRNNVAVLFDYSDQYTGGGFYVWSLVKALAGFKNTNVFVFHDKPSVIYADDCEASDNIKLIFHEDLSKWSGYDVPFDLVLAQPPALGEVATTYAQQNPEKCKAALLVYETPNYIAEYRKGLDTTEEYWQSYRSALLKADVILAISSTVLNRLVQWIPALNNFKGLGVVYPTAHDTLPKLVPDDVFKATYKENKIVLIARNEGYKGLRQAMCTIAESFAIAEKIPVKIVVIGYAAKKLKRYVKDTWARKKVTVELLESVSEQDKWTILTRAKALVHPSEFEGFGIPILEAGLAGVPVVCRPLEVFTECFPHVPHATYTTDEELVSALVDIFDQWSTLYNGNKTDLPHELRRRRDMLLEMYAFSKHRTQLREALRDAGVPMARVTGTKQVVKPEPVDASVVSKVKVALLTTWNTQCGIAETTKNVMQKSNVMYRVFAPVMEAKGDVYTAEDEDNVRRVWSKQLRPENVDALAHEILGYGPNVLHIHHEFSFYDSDALFSLIKIMKSKGIKVTITLHTYMPSGFTDVLETLVDTIVLTKRMQDVSSDKYVVIDLPCESHAPRSAREMKIQFRLKEDAFVVGSFGFWHAHKGFAELMRWYPIITEECGASQLFLVGPHTPKSQYAAEARRAAFDYVSAGHVVTCADFLPVSGILDRLSACDVLAFNYNVLAYYSASAAIRMGMAAGRPIICTESPMFCEFKNEKHVLKVPFGDPVALAKAAARLQKDKDLAAALVANCKTFVDSCSVDAIAKRYDLLFSRVLD